MRSRGTQQDQPEGVRKWEGSSSARTSRSTESSRTRPASRVSGSAAGLVALAARVAKRRPRWHSTRRWAPRPFCWVGGATSSWPPGWPSRNGALAERLNSMPKYVVSSTLEGPVWNNTTVLKGDVIDDASKLKQEIDVEIVVAASFQLWHTLMEHNLVDELRLMIYPVVLGAGERLFGETSDKIPMAPSQHHDRRRPGPPHIRARPRRL